MRDVHIIGVGMIRFGKYPNRTPEELARDAILDALKDCGVDRKAIQSAYLGSLYAGQLIGQRILKYTGMTAIPCTNVENACSTSATALREGWLAIASGLYDMVIVGGVDQLSTAHGALPLPKGDFEVDSGLVMPALYAMRARRYMHDYGVTAEDLAQVVVKNRRHGSWNDHSQFQSETTVEEVMKSRMVADPFTLFHCCPRGDGASAAVLCAADLSARYTTKPIRIAASHLTSGLFMPGFRDMTSPEITVRCAKETYELAGIGPEDIDVAEVHDAFSIAEVLYYEALGFAKKGEGVKILKDGETTVGGRIPVNTSGGLLAKGHPVAATGTAQVAEVVWQLRGQCGKRQVEGAKIGLTHCTGGGVSGYDHGACSIHILQR